MGPWTGRLIARFDRRQPPFPASSSIQLGELNGDPNRAALKANYKWRTKGTRQVYTRRLNKLFVIEGARQLCTEEQTMISLDEEHEIVHVVFVEEKFQRLTVSY